MPKSKKKTERETPDHPEEPLPPAREKSDEEFLRKYSGENTQAMWFRDIIRAQAKQVMKETLAEEVQKAISVIQLQLNQALDKIEDLKSESQKQKRRMERMEFELYKKDEKIDELLVKFDSLEQSQYQQSVQIVGFPENDNDIKAVVKLAKDKCSVKLKSTDIKCTRMGKSKKSEMPRNLIVEFKDQATRNQVYEQRKKLLTNSNPKRNVYINDKLTDHRQHVLYGARKYVKSKRLFAAWSQGGNILARKTERSKITQIHNHNELRKLVDDIPSISSQPEENKSDQSGLLSHLSDYDFSYDSDM